MQWLNEPPNWKTTSEGLELTTGPKTDFWRITHDNGDRHSGHFYYDTSSGSRIVSVRLEGQFNALYDHAGLMVRLDEQNWIKCGIEYVNGVHHRSVVVTRGPSDWSILPGDAGESVWVRVARVAHTIEVSFSSDGKEWFLHRQCYFPPNPAVQIGFMAASPKGDGFRVRFTNFTDEKTELA